MIAQGRLNLLQGTSFSQYLGLSTFYLEKAIVTELNFD
jgi:hypothetical protein